ncbi:hypothetical protein DL95DRAFT_516786 [Leptodontidium sp. 2 PMI_412]|nr:hypothetical protein BKA61DRAFT_556054 [Leptodontidium sp. MPI-SDFR-AT-0119]KAH9224495.1 hypothetical protein DL95DRAFT_516786 [Leptodontidium sp. 2 PMI_412]
MSTRKRKAEDQRTRTTVLSHQPIPRSKAMTARTTPQPPQSSGYIMQRVYWFMDWLCPPSDTDMTPESNDEGKGFTFKGESELAADGGKVAPADHIQSSSQRLDGTVTLKRQRTRNTGGRARPKSAGDVNYTNHVPQSGKGQIDFHNAQNDDQRAEILNAFWEPPAFKFPSAKMASASKSSKGTPVEALDESLSGLRLDPAESPLTPPSSIRHSPQQYESLTPRTPASRIPNTPESLPRTSIRPSKSTSNLGQGDCVKTFFDDERGLQELQIATNKKIELAALKRDKERRELAEKRKAAKQRRLTRQAPLKPLIQTLDTKWNTRVTEVQYSREFSRTLTKSFEGTELRVKDFATLLGHAAWLNDEIINTYIEWIVIAANKAAAVEAEAAGEAVSTVPKFLAHNSFFWNNLRDKGPKSTERLMKRKKAPGTSLLEVDTVFIPINKGAHWTIGLVRPVARTIEYLDSMGGQGADVIQILTGWVKNQLGSQYDEKEWTVPRTPCAYQSNGYDCGVFLCTNALCVALGIHPDCYHQRDLKQQRKNIAAVLLNRGFEGDFKWDSEGFLG